MNRAAPPYPRHLPVTASIARWPLRVGRALGCGRRTWWRVCRSAWEHAECVWNCGALVFVLASCLAARPPFPASNAALTLSPAAVRSVPFPEPLLPHSAAAELATRGWTHVRGAIPAATASALRAALEASPPGAPPELSARLSHELYRAAESYRAVSDVLATNRSAALAAAVLLREDGRQTAWRWRTSPRAPAADTPAVSLLDSIVYGLGRAQPGAGWHVDAPSYHEFETGGDDVAPFENRDSGRAAVAEAPPRAVSIWLALDDVDDAAYGGGLRLVSRAHAPSAAACAPSAETGRPIGGRAGMAACAAALEAGAEGPRRLRAGDALLFAPDVWHRTSPLLAGSPLETRWALVERWADASTRVRTKAARAAGQGLVARLDAAWLDRFGWLEAFPRKPPCARPLRPGQRVGDASAAAGGGCFRTVRGAQRVRAASGAAAGGAEAPPMPWGTSAALRALAMFARLLRPSRLLGACRAWLSYFGLTLAFELPVYALFASTARELPARLAAGGLASALSHPAAYAFMRSSGWLLRAVRPAWRRLASTVLWASVEVAVVAVEARWMRRVARPEDALPSSIAANLASIIGGHLLLDSGYRD